MDLSTRYLLEYFRKYVDSEVSNRNKDLEDM